MTWEYYRRVEPMPPYGDVQRGFSAEVADPLWMLGRQWQVGEHAAEDAASPVLVELEVAHTPLDPVAGIDPTIVPAEALLEGAAEDWWTVGRRARVGRAAAAALSAEQRAANAFSSLPQPYGDTLAGEVDGLALWRAGLIGAGDPALTGFSTRPDFWQPETLTYETAVTAGGATLRVAGHDGSDVDWFTADAVAPLPHPDLATRQVVPQRLHYPGAPAPRWWQIEDAAVDIGGFPPDRSHLATALLIELVCDHANDWFTVPVPSPAPLPDGETPPSSGVVVSLGAARVKDSFDDWWTLTIPPGDDDPPAAADEAPGPWSLFRTEGLDRSSLVVWPTATTPLSGPVMDDVILGVDEDANVLMGGGASCGRDRPRALRRQQRRARGDSPHGDARIRLAALDHSAGALAPLPHRVPLRPRPAGFRPGPRRRPEPEPAGHATRPPFGAARRRQRPGAGCLGGPESGPAPRAAAHARAGNRRTAGAVAPAAAATGARRPRLPFAFRSASRTAAVTVGRNDHRCRCSSQVENLR